MAWYLYMMELWFWPSREWGGLWDCSCMRFDLFMSSTSSLVLFFSDFLKSSEASVISLWDLLVNEACSVSLDTEFLNPPLAPEVSVALVCEECWSSTNLWLLSSFLCHKWLNESGSDLLLEWCEWQHITKVVHVNNEIICWAKKKNLRILRGSIFSQFASI